MGEELGPLIRAKREREGLNIREAGKQSHIAFSTLARIENGATPSVKVYHLIRAWLDGEAPLLPTPPMTLRDWFAGQALAGLCGAFGRVTIKSGETQEQADARWCYARADAMLTERTPK
jgi:transcriptional regulator with XRE-family HTH domain